MSLLGKGLTSLCGFRARHGSVLPQYLSSPGRADVNCSHKVRTVFKVKMGNQKLIFLSQNFVRVANMEGPDQNASVLFAFLAGN